MDKTFVLRFQDLGWHMRIYRFRAYCFPTQWFVGLFAGLVILSSISERAFAHQFGQAGIDHYVRIVPRRDYIAVEHDMHFGELPSAAISAAIDLDQNGSLDYEEFKEYVNELTALYQKRLKLEIHYAGKTAKPVLSWPEGGYDSNCKARTVMGEGRKTIRINWNLKAEWPPRFGELNADKIEITFRRDEPQRQTLASWLYVTGDSGSAFDLLESNIPTDEKFPLPPDITDPQADKDDVPVMVKAKLVYGLGDDLRGSGALDGGMDGPDSLTGKGGQGETSGDGSQGIARLADKMKARIMGLLEPPVSRATQWLVIALCFVWGAMHAFTPGHGKAIAGTYLVSSNASYRHAALLGILVTITHTAVIIILAIAAYILKDRFVYPTWLRPLGAVIILIVGVRQIVVGLRKALGLHTHEHTHGDLSPVDAGEAEGSERQADAADKPRNSVATRDVIAVGVSGGMVPCPASIVLLLLAWQMAMPALGLAAIISFSLGLALTLIAVGFMAVSGTKLIVKWTSKSRAEGHSHFSFESVVPIIGGIALLILGGIILSGFSG